jgi:hypothetical protein
LFIAINTSHAEPESDALIDAIYESAEIGRAVRIEPVPKKRQPDETMKIKRPPLEKSELVAAAAPHAGS